MRRVMAKQTAKTIEQLKGRVDSIFRSLPTFTAGKLRFANGSNDSGQAVYRLINFVAFQELRVGDNVILHGKRVTHPKYGMQFKADVVEHDIHLDADGLALWLQKNAAAKGIGPAKARLIADVFGESFDEVVTHH